MLRQIRLIRNIGPFDSYSTTTLQLGRLTLIYAENGRGKTTLAEILGSLATGNPLPVAARRRLTAQHPPEVVIDTDDPGGPVTFRNNAWSRRISGTVIFDDEFVERNICSGLNVHSDHRQNLHELILGEQGVALNRELQAAIARIEDHAVALRGKAGSIPSAIRGPFSLDEFCVIAVDAPIDANIQATERALAAAKEQEPVRVTPAFAPLSLPRFDVRAIERILQQGLPELEAAAAAARVQVHLSRLGPGGEAWIADGIPRILHEADDARSTCPFCAQDLAGSPVIAHYQAYFSESYRNLKQSVAENIAIVLRHHGGDATAGFERAVRVLVQRGQFWARFCDTPQISLDTAAIAADWRAAREAVLLALNTKQAAPLDQLSLSVEASVSIRAYLLHCEEVDQLSEMLVHANLSIQAVKEQSASGNVAVLTADLARLRAIKARHTPEFDTLCTDYLCEKSAKTVTEQDRDRIKEELERYRTTVFPAYETAINDYLQRLNAGFRLGAVTVVNTRGGPSCTYNVLIDGMPIPVSGGDPAPGEPSFRTALSSGDRNTLALAVFFASLQQGPALADKIIVIDDPVSSLDDHRSIATAQQIRRLAEQATQVVVLSHTKPFLCRIWARADAVARVAVQVGRDAQGSTIQSWDVSQDAVTEHDRDHEMLRTFLVRGTGDKREIAKATRPLLEAFLRVAYPEHFPPQTPLGAFRELCDQRVGTADQVLTARDCHQLADIIEYANRFHHDTNPAWETEHVNDGELRAFVDRVIGFTRR